jgi:hypothetical protein
MLAGRRSAYSQLLEMLDLGVLLQRMQDCPTFCEG